MHIQTKPRGGLRAVSLIDNNTVRGEITGYIAIWGDPSHTDWYGTFFDRESPPEMALDYLPLPLLYEHGYDPSVGIEIIGSVISVSYDDTGIRFTAELNRASPHFDRIVREIQSGILATSSGSSEHVAEFDDEGRFVNWLLTELSLTADPAEFAMPVVELVRGKTGVFYRTAVEAARRGQRDAASRTLKPHQSLDVENNTMKPKQATKSVPKKQAAIKTPAPTQADLDVIRATLEDYLDPAAGDVTLDDLLMAMADEYGFAQVLQAIQNMAPAEGDDGSPIESRSDEDEDEAELEAVTGSGWSAEAVLELLQAVQQQQERSAPKPKRSTSLEDSAFVRNLKTYLRKQQEAQAEAPEGVDPVTPRRGKGAGVRIEVSSKYDYVSAEDLAWGYNILKQAAKRGIAEAPSDDYVRAMAYKAAVNREAGKPNYNELAFVRKFPFVRANEVFQASPAGVDDDWVGELQSTSLWEQVRQDSVLLERLTSKGMMNTQIPDGYSNETIPLEGNDPTWYTTTGGATDIDAGSGLATPNLTSSQIGTGNKNLRIAKISAWAPVQREMTEDSLIPFLPELRRKFDISAREQMEFILLNGDTTATLNNNINLTDGTPAAQPLAPIYLALDGLNHIPLVDNTANARDALAALSETDYLKLLPLLGTDGKHAANGERLLFVIDNSTYFASLNLAAIKTRDVFANATIEEGVFTRIWGIEVLNSEWMKRATATGKRSGTESNNTLGRILLVRPDQLAFRWKRQIDTQIVYNDIADSYRATTHIRFAFGARDTEAAAMSYNVLTTIA